MGERAAAGADRLWITNDNSRSEDPHKIARTIAKGVAGKAEYEICLDRTEAIQRAVQEARAGDLVLVAGKGHEAYQEVGGVRHPFDDRRVVQDALDRRFQAGDAA